MSRHAPMAALLLALAVSLAPPLAAPAAAQSGRPPAAPALRGDPGFVDFDSLGIPEPGKRTLKVSLYGPTLRLLAEAVRGEEPAFADLISKLQGIFAHIYQVPAGSQRGLLAHAEAAARGLERRGWETVFETRGEDGEASLIQVRTGPEKILGLSVMFFDPEGTVGFINVVGDISPEEIGRLAEQLDIDGLSGLELDKPKDR